jgi:hypothetical protein
MIRLVELFDTACDYDTVSLSTFAANVMEQWTLITAAVAEVMPEMLQSVWQETDYRRDVCRITNGSHTEP